MSSTHTPGPWFFKETQLSPEDAALAKKHGIAVKTFTSDDAERIIMCEHEDYPRIAHIAARSRYKRGQGYGHECPERDANARLIAAAPDLLAACEAALERIDGMNEAQGVIDELKAAIAKARGNQ